MLRVMRNHRRAAHGRTEGYEACRSTRCRSTTPTAPTSELVAHAKQSWDKALTLGEATATATRRPP
jgi:ribonucleoside-diphosphate reductase alpha chain